MDYMYIHDAESRTVYRLPRTPTVTERNKRNRLVGWHISIGIEVTRADNILMGNTWKYPVRYYREQVFLAATDTRQSAINYFLTNHTPRGLVIDQMTYEGLLQQYSISSRGNASV